MSSRPTPENNGCAASVLAPVLLAYLASTGWAQPQFAELELPNNPPAFFFEAAFGDVDGDGDTDIVTGWLQTLGLSLNDGTGVFSHAPLIQAQAASTVMVIAMADIDGDADLDIAVGTRAENLLLVNQGGGTFRDETASRIPRLREDTTGLVFRDLDGDGDQDIVQVSRAGTGRVYINSGHGVFTQASQNAWGSAISMTAGDVDGDSDVDVVVGFSGGVRLFLNNGAAAFTDATPQMPSLFLTAYAVQLGDVDRDGDLDLAIVDPDAYLFPFFSRSNYLYLNDGRGVFADASSALVREGEFCFTVLMEDFDKDGDADLIFGNIYDSYYTKVGSSGCASYFESDGTGGFSSAQRPLMCSGRGDLFSSGDLNGDGNLDLIEVDYPGSVIWLGQGDGTFREGTACRSLPGDVDASRAVAAGDVDGDGSLDVVIANNGRHDRLYLNDGRGRFRDDPFFALSNSADNSQAVVLADIDQDGDPDLLVGNEQQQNRLLLNVGAGQFVDVTAARLPAIADSTQALAVADVDGDGDLDLVVGNDRRERNALYLNAAGVFVDSSIGRLPDFADHTYALAFGDVDGDGAPDLLIGNRGLDRLLLNQGGSFVDVTATHLPANPAGTQCVALGDVDGDGDLDATLGGALHDRLYLNDGQGRYSDATGAQMLANQKTTRAMLLVDIDNNGSLDLVVGNRGGSRVYINDGNGNFTDEAFRLPVPTVLTEGLAAGDLDGDGDADLVFAADGAWNPLLLNLLRQVVPRDRAYAGAGYLVDFYARHNPVGQPFTAFFFLSARAARIPLGGLGILGLDPTIASPLPPLPIPQVSGQTTTLLVIPATAGIVGRTFFGQALMVDQTGGGRLTNVVFDTVR